MAFLILKSGDAEIHPSPKQTLKVHTLWADGIAGYVKNQSGYIQPRTRQGENQSVRGYGKGTLKVSEIRNFRLYPDGAPYTIQSAVAGQEKGLCVKVDVVDGVWTILSIKKVNPKVSPFRKHARFKTNVEPQEITWR